MRQRRFKSHRLDGSTAFVRKEIGWRTSLKILVEILEGEDKRARAAQKHPKKLVEAILRGLREELKWRESLSELAGFSAGPSPHGEDIECDAVSHVDDARAGFLDPQRVREARREELDRRRSRDAWTRVPRREVKLEGGRPIDMRWIDTNNGDLERPLCRSSPLARDMKVRQRAQGLSPPATDPFSGAPPPAAFKAPVSSFVSRAHEQFQSASPTQALRKFYRANQHFHGKATRRIWVEPPPEERVDEEAPMASLFDQTTRGTVDTSQARQSDYVKLHKERLRATHVEPGCPDHGDDFGVLAFGSDEEWFDQLLTKRDYTASSRLSSDAMTAQSAAQFNRVLVWGPARGEARIEADVRHADITGDLHLTDATHAQTPSANASAKATFEAEQPPPLNNKDAALHRSLVMRGSLLSQDRQDLSHATSTLAEKTKTPPRYLMFSENLLTRLPAELTQLENLRWLHLFGNRLATLPPGLLTGCRELSHCLLEGNPLSAEATAALLGEARAAEALRPGRLRALGVDAAQAAAAARPRSARERRPRGCQGACSAAGW
ncbi:unnamed protein product [Prorocentrum cordatum]|uniref:Leucine-rich repeat-containing protein 51 n=1 Tax=Prorocentrum cordatum TaxID=2364126 RepID=A0ABN9TMP4_9DINO|nr:unnamed protein product [Polarella glacialis]